MRCSWVALLVLAAGFLVDSARGQSALDTHALAVEAYRAGDYESAETLWREVADRTADDSGFDRAVVLYDLGNCAFRRGDELAAVGWYTAAARLAPRSRDARENLEFARAQAGLEPSDRGDLEATFARLSTALTLAEAEWLVLAALIGLALAFGFEAFRGGVAGRRAIVFALAVLALALVPWLSGLRAAGADPWLVVAEGGAAVRSAPQGDAKVLLQAAAGDQLERTDALPGWVEVELDEGRSGWVPAESMFGLRR